MSKVRFDLVQLNATGNSLKGQMFAVMMNYIALQEEIQDGILRIVHFINIYLL